MKNDILNKTSSDTFKANSIALNEPFAKNLNEISKDSKPLNDTSNDALSDTLNDTSNNALNDTLNDTSSNDTLSNALNDTIVAISTALSKSAISIVRISGPNSLNIAKKLTESKTTLKPRVATLRTIYDKNNQILDKVIMIYFKAPFSYTGEDILEIQSHGGVVIANEILQECTRMGARVALPGEFSKRALQNGKLDALQAQAVVSLINLTNANLRGLLTRNLNGDFSKMLESLRVKLLEIIAQIEVNIDYSEEELDSKILKDSLSTLQNIELKFKNIIESSSHYMKLQNLKLCILGKPNVGKSSILNLLLGKNRAIVSDIEGTTRDAISENIDICGTLVQLIDTAGIRKTKNKIENLGIEKSYEFAKDSDILLCVFDMSREFERQDFELLNFINSINHKYILIILNKNDLEKKNSYDFSGFDTISINTKDSKFCDILKQKIAKIISMEISQDTLILTNALQLELLESSLNHIKNAKTFLQNNTLELASLELRETLQSLGTITKPYNVEEMLDSMFSQFCLGK